MLSSVPAGICILLGDKMINYRDWLMSEKTIIKSQRYYAHFDYRTDISKCVDYISDTDNITTHAFYPFIHYIKEVNKYSRANGMESKPRNICYAAHIDRCIYQLYNFLLNNLYNDYCTKLDINDVAVAYRTNMPGQSNVNFAKKAIEFIKSTKECFIMIGDFTNFFDNLDHVYLKMQWCNLLNTSILPNDHYAVFKNITRYSKFKLSDLLKIHGLKNNKKDIRKLNSKRRVLSPIELRNNTSYIEKNKDYGIPQGSPMSGVLANIYMLEADEEISRFVNYHKGIYMRYSDDFIIVLPISDENKAISKLKAINNLFNNPKYPRLILEPNKTQYYRFFNNSIVNCGNKIYLNADCSDKQMDFLGFKFDGNKVSLRDKTISKYYQRTRRKAKTISKGGRYTKNGNQISMKNLYIKYSERGAYTKKGNFLSYVYRSEEEFGNDEFIHLIPKRNMFKIRKFLKKNYIKRRKDNKKT